MERELIPVSMRATHCPNERCCNFSGSKGRFYTRKGYYRTRFNNRWVRRYRCKDCGKSFSSHTFRSTYGQKRPDVNAQVRGLYCSAMSQRRIARELGINRKTVVRKFLFLALHARRAHQEFLFSHHSSRIQFDEMESFEHTRLKPLTIALAVDEGGGELLGVSVGKIPYRGRLAALARQKYGYRPDESPQARNHVIGGLKHCCSPQVTVTTDRHPAYPPLLKRHFPRGKHLAMISHRQVHPVKLMQLRRRNRNDPLFAINHACARIRHDLSRMLRKVWVTTKKASRLQLHLELYIAYHNQYPLSL